MPIGKNSLKRVTGNGYSKISTSAPDMENSEVSLISEAEKHTAEILTPKTEEGKLALERAKEKASEVAAKTKKADKAEPKEKKPTPAAKAKETVKSMTAEEKKADKPAAKKTSAKAKPAAKAKTEAAKAEATKAAAEEVKAEATAETVAEVTAEDTSYVNLGRGNMPYYLL